MKQLVLDTNLLVLLVVGFTDENLIKRHKRVRTFTTDDFVLLQVFIEQYPKIITTPHVFAECSNLIRQIDTDTANLLLDSLKILVKTILEIYTPSEQLVDQNYYFRLGLTDVGLLKIIKDGAMLLTTDLDLYLAALEMGAHAENFNHLRMHYLLD